MTAPLPPGLLEYDEAHTERLTQAILQAIVTTSTAADTTVLRGREIRDALARALAEFVALEPAEKTCRLIEAHGHFARRLVAHHRSGNRHKLDQVKARMTRVDLASGGRA
jgi:hypothetical protein